MEGASGTARERTFALSLGIAAAATVALVVGYALFWSRFGTGHGSWVVPPTVLLFGAAALVQTWRAAQMDRWSRRGAALVALVGFVVIVLGLGPTGGCGGGGDGCSSWLDPKAPLLIAGVLAFGSAVLVDSWIAFRDE